MRTHQQRLTRPTSGHTNPGQQQPAQGYDYNEYYNTLFLSDEEMGYTIPGGGSNEPKKPKKNIWGRLAWWLCILGCIVALIFCGWQVWSIFNKTILPTDVVNTILESDDDGKVYLKLDWAKLKETYPEIVGWLYVPNTGINYPVVQHKGEEADYYYLEHGAQMEPNEMGAIFLEGDADPEFQADNTMIYGHSVEYYGGMFTGVNRFMTEAHFNQNPYMYLLTPKNTYRADIRLVASTLDGTDYYLTSFGSWENNILQWHLDNAAHSRPEIEVPKGSHLVTLSTCDIRNGAYTDMRYVLQGKLEYYMDDVEYIDDDQDEFLRRMSGILKETFTGKDEGKEGTTDAKTTESD